MTTTTGETEPSARPQPGPGRGHYRDWHEHGMPDPAAIKDILAAVSDRVPDLLKRLSDVLYGEDQAKKFGKAAAVFYHELKQTGMTPDQIFELTRQYMATLNVGQIFSKFAANEHGHE